MVWWIPFLKCEKLLSALKDPHFSIAHQTTFDIISTQPKKDSYRHFPALKTIKNSHRFLRRTDTPLSPPLAPLPLNTGWQMTKDWTFRTWTSRDPNDEKCQKKFPWLTLLNLFTRYAGLLFYSPRSFWRAFLAMFSPYRMRSRPTHIFLSVLSYIF